MSLRERIEQDLKAAMRARDATRLSAIRLLLAAVRQKEVDERRELGDADTVAVVERLIRQRRESVAQYEQARRSDLAAAERFEIEVLSAYLPERLSAEQLADAVTQALAETGAASMRDMGRVMALLRPRLQGRADMAVVSELVRARLAG